MQLTEIFLAKHNLSKHWEEPPKGVQGIVQAVLYISPAGTEIETSSEQNDWISTKEISKYCSPLSEAPPQKMVHLGPRNVPSHKTAQQQSARGVQTRITRLLGLKEFIQQWDLNWVSRTLEIALQPPSCRTEGGTASIFTALSTPCFLKGFFGKKKRPNFQFGLPAWIKDLFFFTISCTR